MNTQQPDDLNRVLEKICEIAEKSTGGDYVYRGEPKCYPKVSSTLYREYEKEIDEESFEIDVVQEEILGEARKYTRETAHDLEILTELQHHGGKTNLIDFTTDYLIALFFSCDGEHDKAGRVILLEKESDDYEVEKPPKTINRVESQKSIFVQASEGFVEPDEVVTVPKGLKQAMLNYLRKHHDISTETIYNDLHGFITKRSIHESAYTLFYKGLTCQDRGNSAKTRAEKQVLYDKAVGHYTEALEQKPDFALIYNNRGVVYYSKGEYSLALQDYHTAIELDPSNAAPYHNNGNLCLNKGEIDLAIKFCNVAISLDSELADAYVSRGNAYRRKGKYDEAFQDYQTALELNPNSAETYTNLGLAYIAKDEVGLAIQNCNKSIELDPELADAYYARALVYDNAGETEKSIIDSSKAIELAPDDYKGYCLRGRTHSAKGDFDLALRDYSTAIQFKPDDSRVYLHRAQIYAEKHEFESAIKDYSVAIKLDPKFASAYHTRGCIYLLLEEFESALQDFDTVIKLDPEFVSAYDSRGLTYWIINEFEHATQDYSEVLELNPDNASAYQYRGFAWLHLGEWNKAKVDLTAARDKGVDIVTSFHNRYQSVTGFAREYGVQVPEDIAELLTRQKTVVGTPLSQNRYALPILTALEQKGGYARAQDALRTVCQLMEDQLEDIDKSRRLDGQEYWKNRAHAMRSELVRKGFLKDNSPHGTWEITDAGREYLRNNRGD